MARKAIYKHSTTVDANTYPDDGTSPVGTTEWNADPAPQGMIGNTPATSTIAIASGVATPTDSVTVVTSESSTTDTLQKLAIANTSEYDLIYLFGNTGHVITLEHGDLNADGEISTVSGANEVLSTTKPTILMRKGAYWYGYGGGTVADGSITTLKIADNAVKGAKIALGSDAAGDIMYNNGTDYVRLAKGGANEVLQINTGATAPEWGTVQATEIAANAVDTSELNADAVTGAKIADDAIDSEHYTDGSIDTAHIADNQITLAKLAGGTDGELITYDASGDPAAVAVGTATHVLTSNGVGVAPTFQATAGGGATIVHAFTNTTTTAYAGTASSFGTVGAGDRDIYIKKIDANNEGVFTKVWKNGSAVEVQLA